MKHVAVVGEGLSGLAAASASPLHAAAARVHLPLGCCEAAFLERHIGDVQLLLARTRNRRNLYGEPWAELDAGVPPRQGAEVLEPQIR